MTSKTPRLRRMIATALPTGIHIAFISVPSLVQVRVLIGLGQVLSTPTASIGSATGNHAEMLRLRMPPLGVRAGIAPEVTQNA
jgi:hypothetical protein